MSEIETSSALFQILYHIYEFLNYTPTVLLLLLVIIFMIVNSKIFHSLNPFKQLKLVKRKPKINFKDSNKFHRASSSFESQRKTSSQFERDSFDTTIRELAKIDKKWRGFNRNVRGNVGSSKNYTNSFKYHET